PRASARMSAQSLCVLMQTKVGVDTILHYTCRDRNLLGIQSDLLGAYALGLRNILAITGDPPKLGDYPDATAVYDVDSIGLIRSRAPLTPGRDLAGNAIGPPLGIHIGCGADPSKPDVEKEVRRLGEKIKAGAEYVMTQPIYDPRTVESFLAMIRHLRVPVLIGILPLYSHKNAEFLHNEVPGMTIPEDIRERMRQAGSGEAAQAEGVRIAQEAVPAVRDLVQGAYGMPPFNKVELAGRVLDGPRWSAPARGPPQGRCAADTCREEAPRGRGERGLAALRVSCGNAHFRACPRPGTPRFRPFRGERGRHGLCSR